MPSTQLRAHIEVTDIEPVYDPIPPGDDRPMYINDHCIARDAVGLFHLFHIRGFDATPWGKPLPQLVTETAFGHAVSPDLRHWRAMPDCIPALRDEQRVAAPCIVEREGVYFMLYNARGPQTIRLAMSADLYDWQRCLLPVFTPPHARDGGWSNGQARDACVLPMDDRWLLYYTTLCGNEAQWHSAIGAAESHDLMSWRDLGPVYVARSYEPVRWSKTESPCVARVDGTYVLLLTDNIADALIAVPSRDPLSFDESAKVEVGPYHASKLYCFDGRWMLTHCRHAIGNGHRGLYVGAAQVEVA